MLVRHMCFGVFMPHRDINNYLVDGYYQHTEYMSILALNFGT